MNRLLDTHGGRLKFLAGGAHAARQVETPAPTSEIVPGGSSENAGQRPALLESVQLVRIIGEPTTPNEAAILADQDKFLFQWLALGLVGACPVEQKKGADHGMDGKTFYRDDLRAPKPEQVAIPVKGGKTGVKGVRDLRGVWDREKAAHLAAAGQRADGSRGRERKLLRAQAQRPAVPVPPTPHREGVDGRKRPGTPVERGVIGQAFKKAPQARVKGHGQKELEL